MSVIIVVVGSVVGSVSLPDVGFVFDLYTKSVALLILKCLCFMFFFDETYGEKQPYEMMLYRTVLFLFKRGFLHERKNQKLV